MKAQNCRVGSSWVNRLTDSEIQKIDVRDPQQILDQKKSSLRSYQGTPLPGSKTNIEANPIPPCDGDRICDPNPIIGYPGEICGRCKKTR